MADFEPLRKMNSFTEDMFNRIIAFQEKEHPAWDSALPFEERIKGLPLHNLIFSNPDRDPVKFGPTVAAYYPLREEIRKIACYVDQVAQLDDSEPSLCDFYPGNGFIGSLIGREDIKVAGMQQPSVKPNQIESFSDSSCFSIDDNPIEKRSCNAVLISWPPAEVNPSQQVIGLQPKLIIYVFTNHVDETTGAARSIQRYTVQG